MGFGDTAKKIQRVTDIAEKLYERLNQVIEQVQDLKDRVESTSDQLDSMDRELAEQRAIVEALAEQQGVDAEAVVAERLPDPDADGETAAGEADGSATENGDETASNAGTTAADAASGDDATGSSDSAATND
jgi:DNA anti-recombination protein RmuC